MKESVTVEIFIIGNEILNGEIQDTNTYWLSKEITAMGGHVSRGTVLRDDLDCIATELRAAMDRGARVIFTSGGLGPTADDLTLAAVAKCVRKELRLDTKAQQMIKESYDALFDKGILAQGGLTPAREKMAWLPQDSIPLYNSVGTAPCSLLHAEQAVFISLPGIPKELKGIFNSSLQPFLQETFRGGISVMHTITVCCNDESLLEPVLTRVVPAHPDVYIKSLATMPGETPELDITLTAVGSDRASLVSLIGLALQDLTKGFSDLGFVCRNKYTKGFDQL
ncbi:MAG: competence/damage-inducible protein A [Geobacter sp.]|nr:MAG: competence/damage-inducible protein A [Geobacter sp.]